MQSKRSFTVIVAVVAIVSIVMVRCSGTGASPEAATLQIPTYGCFLFS